MFTCYTSYGGGSCEVEYTVVSLPPLTISYTTVRLLHNISSINKHGSLHYHSLRKNIWLNIIQSRVLHNVWICSWLWPDINIRAADIITVIGVHHKQCWHVATLPLIMVIHLLSHTYIEHICRYVGLSVVTVILVSAGQLLCPSLHHDQSSLMVTPLTAPMCHKWSQLLPGDNSQGLWQWLRSVSCAPGEAFLPPAPSISLLAV